MKTQITPEWLKNKIEESDYESCEAGISNVELMNEIIEDHAQAMLWHSLDEAAGANLSPRGFRGFLKYRKELKNEGLSWDEAEEILRGYIWGEIEDD